MSNTPEHTEATPQKRGGRLIAFIGTYGSPSDPEAGGITTLEVSRDGRKLTLLGRVGAPREAGYLVYAPTTCTLYAVDERKTDGRGPVEPPASVHALSVSQQDGSLTWLNSHVAPGPRPTFLSLDEGRGVLLTANHGDFEHVEHVVRTGEGTWAVEYLYDDSTVLLYGLAPDGTIGQLRDVQVMPGHGKDPNFSPQAGGHAQASAHAHCAVIDPSGSHVLVGDKGTDRIHVYTLGDTLELVHTYTFPPETGPRHIAFDPVSGRAFVTCEFASALASFAFDPATGRLRPLDQVSTVAAGHEGLNEPAEVRVHPGGRFVYVNNRGEDSLAWFQVADDGRLTRMGHVPVAASLHPGVAARSFAFDPSGSFMLVADRPADLVRAYGVHAADGTLSPLAEVHVPQPAFVEFAELPG
ncbi:lactonase family protein [Streptomyces sp. NPDC047061]|uniref:lactonase family protein n=1 Tax=Streptomyces sp. NPDC047061 TaxID=3154605 RepID=UPI0033DA1F83